MLANLANLSIIENFFFKDVILIYFAYFPNYLPLFLTNIRGVKGANLSNSWLESTCTRNSYIKVTGTEDINFKSIYTKNTYVSNPRDIKYLEMYL